MSSALYGAPRPSVLAGGLLSVFVIAACSDDPPTAPAPDADDGLQPGPRGGGPPGGASPGASGQSSSAEDVCHIVDFNGERETGDIVTEVEVGDFFTLAVAVDPFQLPDGSANPNDNARIFSTDEDAADWAASDLLWQDGSDGTTARCPDCENLGNLLVIEHQAGWGEDIQSHEGPIKGAVDATYGGDMTFSGVGAGEGDFFLRSVTFVDNDADEEPFQVLVNGDTVAYVTDQEDGGVHHVDTDDHPLDDAFTLRKGRPLGDRDDPGDTGSGGIAEFEICTEVEREVGEQACTPGFWRNHSAEAPGNQEDHWPPTGYTVDTPLGDVFDFTNADADVAALADDTLHEALRYGGGPGSEGGAMILLRAAVASLLNAAHPDVDFFWTEQEVIDAVSDALQSSDRGTMLELADELDDLNNQGDCPF